MAQDQFGDLSALATTTVDVVPVALIQGDLIAGGTTANDAIQFERHKSAGIVVRIGKKTYGPYTGVERVIAYGQQGNDKISVKGSLPQTAIFHGGAGNDSLIAKGAVRAILVGDEGNDSLYASQFGGSLLIGGTGRDRLYNAPDCDNVLIGGVTKYDTDDAALIAILNEWTSGNSRSQRIDYLTQGGGLNGSYVLSRNSAVIDDAVVDELFSNLAGDWLFSWPSDKVRQRR
jgi:hypothetical protein